MNYMTGEKPQENDEVYFKVIRPSLVLPGYGKVNKILPNGYLSVQSKDGEIITHKSPDECYLANGKSFYEMIDIMLAHQ